MRGYGFSEDGRWGENIMKNIIFTIDVSMPKLNDQPINKEKILNSQYSHNEEWISVNISM